MITFPHCLLLNDLEDVSMNGWFTLTQSFDVWETDDLDPDIRTLYRAPIGILLDGASIPRFFWRVIGSPFTGRYLRGSVIHDAGYKGRLLSGPSERSLGKCPLDRKAIDNLFYRLMLARGVSKKKAEAMYAAVRVGGWRAWRNAHKEVMHDV